MVCYSHQQSLQIQAKLWALLPKDRLHPDTVYQGLDKGFRGKNTSVVFVDEDGNTIAVLLFKTTKQGPEALASGTVDHIQIDEPTTQACWQECKGRLRRTNGTLRATLTPINSPLAYLQEEVEQGLVSYHRYDLTQANATPVGSNRPLPLEDGSPITDAYIAKLRAETPDAVEKTVLDGHWETRGIGRYFGPYIDLEGVAGSHVTDQLPMGHVDLYLGVDHGSRPGKQIAVLVAVQKGAAWVVDEYTDSTGLNGPKEDAAGIMAMLARNRVEWHELAYAMGDRVHMKGTARQKSNEDIMDAMAKQMGLGSRHAMKPQLKTVKKSWGDGRGYVSSGARWIHTLMVEDDRWHVHPRCERVRYGLNNWTGPGPDCDEKDPVDALRYALEPLIYPRRQRPPQEIVAR